MSILETDIKLLASQVMADVPEGGGAITGTVIADGASNGIFPDISELDRTTGVVHLRKIAAAVQTMGADTYYGVAVLVEDPPDDPRVSCTLFATEDAFDRRTSARNRIESFRSGGARGPWNLYENHIAGQRAVMLIARLGVELPSIGQTLLLKSGTGVSPAYEQYVRVTKAVTEDRTFAYSTGSEIKEYQRQVIVCDISDALGRDFPGSPASPLDAVATGAAQVYETLVADAARYYGAARLTEAAELGDVSLQIDSVYSQLVPSAQTDIPVADASANGSVISLQAASDAPITFTTSAVLSPSAALYVGGAWVPGSLSIVIGGTTLTDQGAALRNGGEDVGTVDAANGVVRIAPGGATYSGSKTVAFQPAVATGAPTHTRAIPVTSENRSATLVFSLDPVPTPGSLSISFLAMGEWYVLQDDGSGALRGSSTAVGAGNLSRSTGTVTVTLGALPDVGSAVLVAYGSPAVVVGKPTSSVTYTLGLELELPGPIGAGTAIVSWEHEGSKLATAGADDVFAGDGVGRVDHMTRTRIFLTPDELPPPGTEFVVEYDEKVSVVDLAGTYTGDGTTYRCTFPAPIALGTFRGRLQVQHERTSLTTFAPETVTSSLDVHAGNSGTLYMHDQGFSYAIGTLNHTTGEVAITRAAFPVSIWIDKDPIILPAPGASGWNVVGYRKRPVTSSLTTTAAIVASFATTATTPKTEVVTPTILRSVGVAFRATNPGALAGGAVFSGWPGGLLRGDLTSRALLANFDPATGTGTSVGEVAEDGTLLFSTWVAEQATTLTQFSQAQVVASQKVSRVDGRTPVAPIRPGNFSITAVNAEGATISATADEDGVISGAGIAGTINYQTGVYLVQFVAPSRSVTYPTYSAGTGGSYNGYSSATPTGSASVASTAAFVDADSIRINAVGYSYLPLDADIIGIDPVRLPQDGRVPIFRPGDVAVLHHTARTAPETVGNGDTIDCGRVRLSRARVFGANGVRITTGFTADLDAGTVTFTDVSGYSQPVEVEHRIADQAVLYEVQITGAVALARPLTHNFPIGSVLSSALVAQVGGATMLQARVSHLFDQETWSSVWSDSAIGAGALATFNDVQYPVVVTNDGAITERWLIRFTGSTAFTVTGEHVGQIATGNITTDLAPINPNTGQPYFSLDAAGWGSGWGVGNCLRINTVGAILPFWVARTVQMGPATETNDGFTLLTNGDIDQP